MQTEAAAPWAAVLVRWWFVAEVLRYLALVLGWLNGVSQAACVPGPVLGPIRLARALALGEQQLASGCPGGRFRSGFRLWLIDQVGAAALQGACQSSHHQGLFLVHPL